jgi:hypothetical protein
MMVNEGADGLVFCLYQKLFCSETYVTAYW